MENVQLHQWPQCTFLVLRQRRSDPPQVLQMSSLVPFMPDIQRQAKENRCPCVFINAARPQAGTESIEREAVNAQRFAQLAVQLAKIKKVRLGSRPRDVVAPGR
jgi:hypothetical protein